MKIPRSQIVAFEACNEDPISFARHLLVIMRRRMESFPDLRIADPEWAILLDLLVQSSMGRSISVQSSCLASGVPPTTALRHLTALTRNGAVIRQQDPFDGRRIFVRLSRHMETRLLEFLGEEARRAIRR